MQFATTIRVGGAGGMVFIQEEILGLAIHRGAAAEHESLVIHRLHRLQQTDGALHVVGVVLDRLLHRFARGLQLRKVNDGIDLVTGGRGLQQLAITNIAFGKRPCRLSKERSSV